MIYIVINLLYFYIHLCFMKFVKTTDFILRTKIFAVNVWHMSILWEQLTGYNFFIVYFLDKETTISICLFVGQFYVHHKTMVVSFSITTQLA